ncbi:predicted protein [Plenodomus lingam JN3]|uniref:Predicted protein n=1 Tax=Leptosphaeria maculans (strain JN3 / isolate v23.1.3 / race Av1-4-5-6-7-8) TaxID=985895 RepID=E4ZW90_LEPMJ|nr:predicted protein [Plenodomus lingam JN3]CBX95866.1 predicted protein [Plenodomus lingam JN3]
MCVLTAGEETIARQGYACVIRGLAHDTLEESTFTPSSVVVTAQAANQHTHAGTSSSSSSYTLLHCASYMPT